MGLPGGGTVEHRSTQAVSHYGIKVVGNRVVSGGH